MEKIEKEKVKQRIRICTIMTTNIGLGAIIMFFTNFKFQNLILDSIGISGCLIFIFLILRLDYLVIKKGIETIEVK